MAANPRRCFWFGTQEYMQWFPTPIQGAEMSPEGWSAGGTFLNGGGWQLNSFGSHKTYTFEWPQSSSREAAQMMKSYADGTYGRGPLYFLDPLIYDQNILPARIADPSMATDDEGASFVYGYEPSAVATSNWQQNLLPVKSAYYDLTTVSSGFRGVEDATFVPIPEGYTLFLGAFYSKTGTGGIFVTEQNANGTLGATSTLTAKTPTDTSIAADLFFDVPGVWIWLGKTASGAATVTAQALIGRLLPSEDVNLTGLGYGLEPYGLTPYGGYASAGMQRILEGPWRGGMGHSGARPIGKPTYVANSSEQGGRIGFAASFREVGSWLNG